jgi:hypothetical protein
MRRSGSGKPPLGLEIGLAANDEETASLVKAMQAFEVQIAAVQKIEGARLGQQQVEHLDLGEACLADIDERGDGATQVEQGMHAHARLAALRRGPRKQGQTQIDQRGVQCIDGFVQLHRERLVGIESARNLDQALSELGVDTPIARSIGMRQG